jgi:catechol 2,3-dioxygenase-like lactoylglutathione lyase family enzyme
MTIRQAVPFFMVADMDASLRFYVDGLGFTKTRDWTPNGAIEWCWLERDGVALMLQAYRAGRMPEDTRGVGVSVCFQCTDALALYRAFTGRGLTPKRPFVGNGMWVVVIKDPDGYTLDFESETDVPEETEYDALQHK